MRDFEKWVCDTHVPGLFPSGIHAYYPVMIMSITTWSIIGEGMEGQLSGTLFGYHSDVRQAFRNPNQQWRQCCPISKICMFLLMDAKISMISLIIVFAMHPICFQDFIFKMSSTSPGNHWQFDYLFNSLFELSTRNVKALNHWHLSREPPVDPWIPFIEGQ